MTSKLIEEVEKLRPKSGDQGYCAGSARVDDVVDQVIALLLQHGAQVVAEAMDCEREAVEAMVEAMRRNCELLPNMPSEEEDARAALAADPLRRRLGPVAVQAIMEGKAAVIQSFQPGGWMLYKIQYVDESGSDWEIDSGECRLHRLREER